MILERVSVAGKVTAPRSCSLACSPERLRDVRDVFFWEAIVPLSATTSAAHDHNRPAPLSTIAEICQRSTAHCTATTRCRLLELFASPHTTQAVGCNMDDDRLPMAASTRHRSPAETLYTRRPLTSPHRGHCASCGGAGLSSHARAARQELVEGLAAGRGRRAWRQWPRASPR